MGTNESDMDETSIRLLMGPCHSVGESQPCWKITGDDLKWAERMRKVLGKGSGETSPRADQPFTLTRRFALILST